MATTSPTLVATCGQHVPPNRLELINYSAINTNQAVSARLCKPPNINANTQLWRQIVDLANQTSNTLNHKHKWDDKGKGVAGEEYDGKGPPGRAQAHD